MSTINVNITYVFTGWDDIENVAHNLYAGYDEEIGEEAVRKSIYCDFEKEVWHNGERVQVYNKPRIEAAWSLGKDKLRFILDEALETSGNLVKQLDKIDGIKGLAKNPTINKEVQVKIRDISNNVNTIKHVMESLNV
ncbi:ssDNA-binding transcriptional regulator [Bacillus phage vB_BcgM]|nr:ssDNA-binding transcriptional regulator [Bacillus phage vB_BcgM]